MQPPDQIPQPLITVKATGCAMIEAIAMLCRRAPVVAHHFGPARSRTAAQVNLLKQAAATLVANAKPAAEELGVRTNAGIPSGFRISEEELAVR